jgi:hypothetical protein
MKRWIYPGALLLALAFFSILMIRLTLPYTAMRSNTGFLRTKLHIYHLHYWRFNFYTHVFVSCMVLLAVLWISFTALAGYYAFRRRFTLHGAFMFRSYALTLSAITLRAYTYIIDWLRLPIHPIDTYILTAWLSWIPNLLLAEWLIRKGWVEKVYSI